MDRAVVFAFYALILWLVYSYFGTVLNGVTFLFEESRALIARKAGAAH